MSDPLRFELPPEVLDAICDRVVERLKVEQDEHSPWLAGAKSAGQYLGWPTQRIYNHLHELPHYKHGNRLMFRRDELDAFFEALR